MDIEQSLVAFGLSQKEALCYKTLLEVGETSLQNIGKRLDLPRTTVYNTLNYLIEKGLASLSQKMEQDSIKLLTLINS